MELVMFVCSIVLLFIGLEGLCGKMSHPDKPKALLTLAILCVGGFAVAYYLLFSSKEIITAKSLVTNDISIDGSTRLIFPKPVHVTISERSHPYSIKRSKIRLDVSVYQGEAAEVASQPILFAIQGAE